MKYTQIIKVPSVDGTSFPVLIVKDKISILALTYARELSLKGRSSSTIHKILQSLSFFWDFYFTFEDRFEKIEPTSILKLFSELRLNGTVDHLGEDPLHLYWKSVKLNTVKLDISNISEYTLYLESNFNTESLNPMEKKFQDDIEYIIQKNKERKFSFFYHLKKNEKFIQKSSFSRDDSFGRHTGFTAYKAFPHDKVNELIKVSKLRDKLIFLLLAYGGCRGSEVLHIFINDIYLNQKNNTATVILGNPVEAKIKWKANSKDISGTRREFLLTKFNLKPRNLLRNKFYSGWKTMTEDDGKNHLSFIYWTNPEMGELFYKLHLEYMKIRLEIGLDHPYYFVSLSPQTYGEPLTLNALKDKFNQLIKKIGLDIKDDGVNLHGLRHFYGFYCANKINVSKEIAQRMLHHKSISSTEVYYQKTLESIETALSIGYDKLKNKEIKND
jgi:integrase